jgi:hypothetical protein
MQIHNITINKVQYTTEGSPESGELLPLQPGAELSFDLLIYRSAPLIQEIEVLEKEVQRILDIKSATSGEIVRVEDLEVLDSIISDKKSKSLFSDHNLQILLMQILNKLQFLIQKENLIFGRKIERENF